MKKVIILLAAISFFVACKKEQTNVTTDQQKIAFLNKCTGTFYCNNFLGMSDSVVVTHNINPAVLDVYSSAFNSTFQVQVETIYSDSTAQLKSGAFYFKSYRYNQFGDSIINGVCISVQTVVTTNTSFMLSYQFNGTYTSVTSPTLNNTYNEYGYVISRHYTK